MKLLLDECVPRRLKRDFSNFDILTVDEANYKGLKNGKLLNAAQHGFDVLIIVDKSIKHQQNLGELNLSIIILTAFSNRYESLAPLIPQAIESLKSIKYGEIITIK